MKLSICTGYFELSTPEDAVLSLKEAGFSHGELAVEHSLALLERSGKIEKTGLAFRAFLEDHGFSLPQGHLEFRNDMTTLETVESLKKEITLFQAIGIKNAVFHINGGLALPEEARLDAQRRSLRDPVQDAKGKIPRLQLIRKPDHGSGSASADRPEEVAENISQQDQ